MATSVRGRRGAGVALLCVLSLGLAAAVDASAGAPAGASSWQGGPLHDGHAADGSFVPPLSASWRVDLPDVSHVVAGDGRAYVLSTLPRDENGGHAYGNVVHALDPVDGARLWSSEIGGTYSWAGHAFDDGRLFTVNGDGLVRAHDAATGDVVWSKQLDQYAFSSPPVADGGVLYVAGAGSGGTLYALAAATGQELWRQSVSNGDHSSPVVTADRVHVSYACGRTHAFDRRTGLPVWDRTTTCGGGGGKTAVLHEDRLYVRDDQFGAVLDARTGSELDVFTDRTAPAFHAGTGFFVRDGRLEAEEAASGRPLWVSGVSGLVTPPVVAAGHVYVGGPGRLYAFDEADGRLVWQGDTPVDGVDEHNVSQPYDGITVAGDRLFVTGGDTLTSYTGVLVAPQPSATARPTPSAGSPAPSPSSSAVPSRSPTSSPAASPSSLPLPLPSCVAVPGVVTVCRSGSSQP